MLLIWNVLESKSMNPDLFQLSDLQQITWFLCASISSTSRGSNDIFSIVCMYVCMWEGVHIKWENVSLEHYYWKNVGSHLPQYISEWNQFLLWGEREIYLYSKNGPLVIICYKDSWLMLAHFSLNWQCQCKSFFWWWMRGKEKKRKALGAYILILP